MLLLLLLLVDADGFEEPVVFFLLDGLGIVGESAL